MQLIQSFFKLFQYSTYHFVVQEKTVDADLIWLENLNLRGQFKGGIMTYIREKYPDLIPLYVLNLQSSDCNT